MMKVCTYHPNSSNTVGGVQELLRQLGSISAIKCFVEVFDSPEGDFRSSDVDYNARYVNLYKSPRLFYAIERRLRLRCFLKKSDSDVIIIFNPVDLLFIPIQTLKKKKVIFCQINSIDIQFKTYTKWLFRLGYKRFIDAFTVYTDFDKKRFISYLNLCQDKVHVIPRGCKLKTLSRPKKPSKSLVTICRLYEKQKYLFGMMKVFSKLPKDYTLDIYGVGNEREIEYLKTCINHHDRISYKGPVYNIASTLENYSLFLMTSRYEGFGQTLIEARSQGLPIVAYNTFDAARWIVKDGINGWLIPFEDVSLFAERIRSIVERDDVYAKYSKEALALAKDTEKENVLKLWEVLLVNLTA